MISRILVLAALSLLSTLPAHAAAPSAFHAYCMVLEDGAIHSPPQAEVRLEKGETRELSNKNGISFQVTYGDVIGLSDVIQLVIKNTVTNKQNLNYVVVDKTFPSRIDLVTEAGSITCSTMN